MKIETIITCVNYHDVLAFTLPINRTHFHKTLVVTSKEDKDTQRLCQLYNVEFLATDAFFEDGSVLNKGRAINEGLKHLDKDGWVLQMDADCLLMPQTMQNLYSLNLNPQFLYGCDRILIESFVDFVRFIQMPDIYEENWLMNLSKFKMGSRITQYYSGQLYQILGFFQLWNPSGSKVTSYPDHDDASRSDILFSEQFHRSRRSLIPEVIAVHLEEGTSQTGKNWTGRNSKKFGL